MSAPPDGSLFSHWPSHPPPVLVNLHVSAPHPCSYFSDRESTTRALWASGIEPELYHQFMDAGFRRSGKIVYQPICTGCRRCVALRVPVGQFTPSKTQRRAWRANQDLGVTISEPEATEEKFEIYQRYRKSWHGAAETQGWNDYISFLYDSPVATAEICYRDRSGQLLGVGLCDVCANSVSTVYFYFDPAHAKRELGTFSALWELDWARRLHIPWYYLGFWVKGCGAMEYKSRFRPCELLGSDGVWRSIEEACISG